MWRWPSWGNPVTPRTKAAGGLGLVGSFVLPALLLFGFPVVTGHAASLGGLLSASIFAATANPALAAALSDDFAAASPTDLDGRALATGQIWSAPPGVFEVEAGLCTSILQNAPFSMATVPWLDANSTQVSASLVESGARDFGLVLHADGGAGSAVALRLLAKGDVQIARYESGSWSTLASATATTDGDWVLRFDNGVYSAIRNGTVVASYSASAGEQAAWRAGTDVGIYVEGKRSGIWSNFQVVTP